MSYVLPLNTWYTDLVLIFTYATVYNHSCSQILAPIPWCLSSDNVHLYKGLDVMWAFSK